jgi:hypothetical protein
MTYTVVVVVPPVAADDDAAWLELDALIEAKGSVAPALEELVERVTAKYPCLSQLDDAHARDGVWSDAPLRKQLGLRAGVFRIASRTKEVAAFLASEATALGLVAMNTAAHTIHRPDRDDRADDSALAFFKKLSGVLRIQLSEPTERITEALENQKATPTAVIVSLRLEATVYENDDFRELTEEELSRVVFEEPAIVLRGFGRAISHSAPNGVHFTVRDMLAAVEETERQTRGESEWFEGVDVHHVFFEGIHLGEDGVWEIHWGS